MSKYKVIMKKSLAENLKGAGHEFVRDVESKSRKGYRAFIFIQTPGLIEDMLKFNQE
ncbi:hypothetical protein [Planococcus sp. ISL-109]|uniref:hypothetical protein n=1 Tax=Planococcus sp. ISL-109 TaxID=2819166 RepID=UPI001BEC3839|nr:hypothetical protein [Planococcus sp. ISL-109]MBT2581758.1 hypothetical protein [Planococcus sp. ISL-109]